MQNLLKNLNEEQLAAVTLPAQSALILAGAGSGKTKVLTTRIAWLIQSGQVSTSGILAVTFTNKASKEMLNRLSNMLQISTNSIWVGTFHGLCNRFLRFHYQDAGLPKSFQILDSQDQISVIRRLLKKFNIDSEKYPPKELMYFFNKAKDRGLRANEIEIIDDVKKQYINIYSLYEEQCNKEGNVDFAELLLRSYDLLHMNEPLRNHYQNRFKYILIDEFQDTNDLQYKWLKLLSGNDGNVFAVGDDDQSIYAFRGANVDNMSLFKKDFRVKNLIKLEKNYRSFGHILDTANYLISHNNRRLGKNLHTDLGHGELIRIFEAESDLIEAKWLIEEISYLVSLGWSKKDIAFLYRSNAQSRIIEYALFSASIPYKVYGGLRFFERAEIKYAIAYIALINNLNNDSAFMKIVNFPSRGIGMKSLEYLQKTATNSNNSLYSSIPFLEGKPRFILESFKSLIENISKASNEMSLPNLIDYVLAKSKLIDYYKSQKDGLDRVENLKQLSSASSIFLSEEGFNQDSNANEKSLEINDAINLNNDSNISDLISPLDAFLSYASLEAGDAQSDTYQDAIQLMTVHSAKGLEFDAVFITGLEEGLFPHENSEKIEDGIEEERRLMYVAITRARKRLYLSFAQSRMLHGQKRFGIKSRFFNELPQASLNWLNQKYHFEKDEDNNISDLTRGFAGELLPTKNKIGSFSWQIGQSVFHKKFGEGVIVNIEGNSIYGRANINFGSNGMKLLDLSIAKLEKI